CCSRPRRQRPPPTPRSSATRASWPTAPCRGWSTPSTAVAAAAAPSCKPPSRRARTPASRRSARCRARRPSSPPPGWQITVGWVKREHPGATASDAEIYVVATDPSVQGHGVAGHLLAASLRRLQEAGVPGVELYVEADNAPALRLYENWGFAVSGRDVQMRATARR